MDPFDYSFKDGVAEPYSIRRKLAVAEAVKKIEKIHKHVLGQVADRRLRK
jgi:hypothetical protein